MSESAPPPSYESFGDTRPNVEELKAIIAFQPPWQSRIAHSLLRSEAYLDLAVSEPERAGRRIRKAGHALNEVVAMRRASRRKGLRRFRQAAHLQAAAQLRRPELENWRKAIQGEPIENNYEALLEAAADTLPLLDPGRSDDLTRARLIEFTPILLGARSGAWLGRLALRREEGRTELPDEDTNLNWDTGIVFDNDPAAFVDPSIKLSLKPRYKARGQSRRSRLQRHQSYIRGGVIPIAARDFGFDNPRQVVLSCMNEHEPVPEATLEGLTLLSSGQLDDNTMQLRKVLLTPVGEQGQD